MVIRFVEAVRQLCTKLWYVQSFGNSVMFVPACTLWNVDRFHNALVAVLYLSDELLCYFCWRVAYLYMFEVWRTLCDV